MMTDSLGEQAATPVNEAINPEDYFEFVKTLVGQRITTQGGRSTFQVIVRDGRIKFVPDSTGKERHTDFRKVLATYEELRSFTLSDYTGFTVNASYHLPLIAMYLRRDVG